MTCSEVEMLKGEGGRGGQEEGKDWRALACLLLISGIGSVLTNMCSFVDMSYTSAFLVAPDIAA